MTGRKNKKPEKIVESQCLIWARQNKFFVHVIESRATRLAGGKGFKNTGNAPKGIPDLVGNTIFEGNALPVYIELKAKDRRSSLSFKQYIFLCNKIEQGCFATVVDSVERLDEFWTKYKSLQTKPERTRYLFDCLPRKTSFHRT